MLPGKSFFSTLAELTIFAILILFYRLSGSLSLNDYFHGDAVISLAGVSGALIVLVIVALFMVLLTENSRVPVDDPATHLELTMIHEVMILDHSGLDLAPDRVGILLQAAVLCSLYHPVDLSVCRTLQPAQCDSVFLFAGPGVCGCGNHRVHHGAL